MIIHIASIHLFVGGVFWMHLLFCQNHKFMPHISIKPVHVAATAVIAVVTAFVWFTFALAVDHCAARYYYASFPPVVLVLAVVQIWSKRRELTKLASDRYPKLHLAQIKRRAELAAAGALMAFVWPYFQQGLALDRLVAEQRLVRIDPIRIKIQAALPPDFCHSKPFRETGCKRLEEDLNTLAQKIIDGPETDVTTTIRRLQSTLQEGFDVPSETLIHDEITDVVNTLNSLIIEDRTAPLLLPFLQLMSLLFASYAFSTKVALAWHDVDQEKAKEATTSAERNPPVNTSVDEPDTTSVEGASVGASRAY